VIGRRAKPNRKQGRGTRRGAKSLARALIALAVLAAAGIGFWYGVRQAGPDLTGWADQLFEITIVETAEGRRVSREEILALLDLAPGQGLVSADVRALEQAVETHPWIRHAEVRRVFPHTLAVEVQEREPVAVLRAGGREFLLDRSGALMAEGATGTFEALPVLTGVDYAQAVWGSPGTIERVRSGIALAGLLEQEGARRMEVDLRTPGDLVAYYSGLRFRFGDGSFEDKVDRYRRVSDRVLDRWGKTEGSQAEREVEVDLRFRDRIIVRERG
jgi:cell division septal protein FtsQ